jgi:uncharacterized protein YerC
LEIASHFVDASVATILRVCRVIDHFERSLYLILARMRLMGV